MSQSSLNKVKWGVSPITMPRAPSSTSRTLFNTRSLQRNRLRYQPPSLPWQGRSFYPQWTKGPQILQLLCLPITRACCGFIFDASPERIESVFARCSLRDFGSFSVRESKRSSNVDWESAVVDTLLVEAWKAGTMRTIFLFIKCARTSTLEGFKTEASRQLSRYFCVRQRSKHDSRLSQLCILKISTVSTSISLF